MASVQNKSRVVLEGGKLIGSFLFFTDTKGRPCFKFSLKPKLGSAEVMFEDRESGSRKRLSDHSPPEMSVDVSFKFADRLLELKRQESGKPPERHFIKTPLPPEAYLFSVRIKNWQNLPVVPISQGTLELKPPTSASNVALVFSFAGKEGRPYMVGEYLQTLGRTILLTLPVDSPFDKLWIGVVPDENNQEPYDLTIKAPNYA